MIFRRPLKRAFHSTDLSAPQDRLCYPSFQTHPEASLMRAEGLTTNWQSCGALHGLYEGIGYTGLQT